MNRERAFPRADGRYDNTQENEQGMTLRDYFAAKAMHGDMTQGIHKEDFKETAARAYKMADDMMEARNV